MKDAMPDKHKCVFCKKHVEPRARWFVGNCILRLTRLSDRFQDLPDDFNGEVTD